MDKELKNEFEKINKHFEKVDKRFDKINSQIEILAATINNDVAKKEDLENLEKKMDTGFEKMNKKFKDLEENVNDISAKVQIQKNVPIIRKVNEKVNKHIEIHEKRGNITKEDIAVISKINPFPSKEALAQ